MKKFFLALLSIFIVIGGGVLAACQAQATTLKLSHDSVAIEILNNDPDGGYQIITAEVSGASDNSVKASTVSGYENIIQVSTQKTTSGKTQITVRGLTEGYAEFIVRTTQGNVYKVVNVDVYSTVSEMEQKVEEGGQSQNFLVKGKRNKLVEENLLSFTPSVRSRRTITWSLKDAVEGINVNGDIVNIENSFVGDEITLVATTEKGVTTEVILPVLNPIQDGVDLYWSYQDDIGGYDQVLPNTQISIVPNLPESEEYEAYVYVDYDGDLDVKGYVLDENDQLTTDVEISRQGTTVDNKPKFKISANRDLANLNSDYKLYFEIGYDGYDYKVSTLDTTPIKLSVKEKVNRITVATKDIYDLQGKTIIAYSNYDISKEKGELLSVSVLPTTVIGKTDKYTISYNITGVPVSPLVPEGQWPVEFWYKNTTNNTWTEVAFNIDGNTFTSATPVVNENIYIKANSNLLASSFDGIEVTFISEDNTDVSSTFDVKLVQSAKQEDFVFVDADFRVDSSEEVEDTIARKTFTLNGQSNLDGLYIISDSEHVVFDPLRFISTDGDSVTFEVLLTLKRESYGVTQIDSYRIAHKNGLLSDEYKIDIFLPFESAGVIYDNSVSSNSVTNYSYTNEMYNSAGEIVDTSMQSLSNLMLKNNTNTPLFYQFNTSSGKSAIADIEVRFIDYKNVGGQIYNSLEEFKNLINDDLIYLLQPTSSEETSSIVGLSSDKKIISTKNVGFTYVIYKFTGKGVNVDSEIFYRIILVESYISPEGLEVSPQKDKQVTLFANDSVSSSNIDDTKKRVTISFNNFNVTYHTIQNFNFVSTTKGPDGKAVMGDATKTETAVNWSDGRYSISNIVIGDFYISFDINALSTKGDFVFSDELNVHYVLTDDANRVYYDIYTRVDILIKNAQRIEKLVWVNSNDEGINFRIGDRSPHYMVFASNPNNAKNLNLYTLVTKENGDVAQSFVNISNPSLNTIGVNLDNNLQNGMKGYIYILPEDAVYESQIKYHIDGVDEVQSVAVSQLGQPYSATQTWYDYLILNAYFTSNATTQSKKVYFKDVIIKIDVEVDDGRSFDYAYKVYELEDFYTQDPINVNEKYFNPDLYYTIMRNIDISELTQNVLPQFNGGLQGVNEDITLTTNKPFTAFNNGEIRNIAFVGNVEGKAFVAETNSGTISNVTIDTNGTYASTLTYVWQESEVGGIAGKNTGTITGAKVLGLTISASGNTVGGIAGNNEGTVSNCLVEFYNLETTEDGGIEKTYDKNTFTGLIVGAIVGAGTCTDCDAVQYLSNDPAPDILIGQRNGDFPRYETPSMVSVDFAIQTYQNNGYYKSIAVDSTSGLLFYYSVRTNGNELTSTEKRDLKDLNTIDLKDLIGQENVKNVIVASNNPNIVSVEGTTLYAKSTGEVKISIYLKQNVQINKTFNVKVVNALTKIKITWTDGLSDYEVKDNTEIAVQKTKTRTFNVGYEVTDILLGNLANKYELILSEYELKAQSDKANVSILNDGKVLANAFVVSSNDGDSAVITLKLDGDNSEIVALNNVFKRQFKINPIDGVIEFNLSEENLPITPSTNGSVRVRITTTAVNDEVIPNILTKNGIELTQLKEEGIIKYYLPTDLENSIIDVKRITVSSETDSINTYVYDVNFAVSENYVVREDMAFDVYFTSTSGSSSRYQNGGVFELTITRQNFTNIDMTNIKIEGSQYKKYTSQSGEQRYITFHTPGSQTAILAPGTSSILRVNINPEFAFYDYMELSYSGAAVIDAVMLEYLEPLIINTEKGFIRSDENISMIGSTLRYTPDMLSQSLYFRVWVNTTVNTDTVIKFTASFYANDSQECITYANYYLTVSYLKEPTITIDGLQTAYIAKGSTSEVEVVVLADQTLDSLELVGEDYSNIDIYNFTDHGIDQEKGIRRYTALLNAKVRATAKDNVVYVQGKVSREINGNIETKTTIATAKIVDFKIDTDKIGIKGAENGAYEVWLGVPKAFEVDYNLIPESYTYAQSDLEAVQTLLAERRQFLKDQYFPSDAQHNANQTSNFYINYDYQDGNMVPKTIQDRLFYVVDNNTTISIKDQSDNWPVRFDYDEQNKTLTITGNKIGQTVRLKLETYLYADNVKTVYSTYINVTVTAYSDEDIPLLIKNAEEFMALKPEQNETSPNQNDYILTNDILLESYESFSTNKIRSLDGNGYTIFIKSFNVEPASTTTLNLALFNIVQSYTTLKNVRVNLYNGGQLTIDKSVYKNINVAGFAIRNEGVIYNSEVMSFYTEVYLPSGALNAYACDRHSNPEGINIKYVNGKNTSDPVYITEGSNWASRVAGFVVENAGSITNSRVGGDDVTIINNGGQEVNGAQVVNSTANRLQLSTFHINGQGNMAGFVLQNTGSIASSYAKNIDMENKSNSTRFYLAGFVGQNYSSIITSYVEGVLLDGYSTDEDSFEGFVREGSSLKSTLGYIAGFIYSNSGNVKDAYSNILISNSSENQKVYLVSGFVYENSGDLYNCFSASQISNARYTQMNFSGVDEEGNLLSSGSYTNCYYFNLAYASVEDFYDNSTESQFDTGAIVIGNPKLVSNFYGFAIASTKDSDDGIWYLDEETGITLICANNIAISHRYVQYIDDEVAKEYSRAGYNFGQDENGKYVLPYSTIIYQDNNLRVDTKLGTSTNPIIISNAETFVKVTGTSTSTVIKEYFTDTSVSGNYRIVNNIQLSDLISSDDAIILPSTSKILTGKIDGNGFTISNLSTTSRERGVGYGLFVSLNEATIINLNLTITQVGAGDISMVGGLAGFAKDSKLININVEFNDESGITGLNFAGGLVGAVFGSTKLNNISVENPKVKANKIPTTDDQYFDLGKINTLRGNLESGGIDASSVDYSYAGGVVGYVDCYTSMNEKEFKYNKSADISINNVKVNGELFIRASVAGGIFGLTSHSTYVKDAGVTITGTTNLNNSKILATNFFAGGVAGQSYGGFDRIFAKYEKDTQNAIENNIAAFYQGNTAVERGATDIFYTKDGDYAQKYVGGLVGFVQSGSLTISYSKLNVVSPLAQFAGGIIGGIEVSDANTYDFEVVIDKNKTSVNTNYILYEVYATGDVRANTFAGGIFGAIKNKENENAKIRLYNVNALNYLSNYDYENETYLEVTPDQTNLSTNLKTNLIVGQLFNGDTLVNPSVLEDTQNNYTSFFGFAQRVVNAEGEPTFGNYQYYRFNGLTGPKIYFNLFGQISNDITNNSFYEDPTEFVFAITGPADYTNAQTGHSYTQNAFLNGEIWDANNWTHNYNDLFAEIRYSTNFQVLYLDQYNVKEVFDEMSKSGAFTKVVVRGLVSEGGTEFGDIEVGPNDGSIDGFSGVFVGTPIYTTSEGRQVKIISNRNFITSVGPGFVARNLKIDYSSCTQIDQGLFINNPVGGISIKNLEITVSQVTKNQTSQKNIGLIAPSIENSSINGLKIIQTTPQGETSGNAILNIAQGVDSDEVNIGLIAGTITQTSAIQVNTIEKITLPENNNGFVQTISIDGTSSTQYNVGTYFGKVSVKVAQGASTVQDLKLNISDLNSSILFNGLSSNPSVNVGGYFGQADGINNITIMPGEGDTPKILHVAKFTGTSTIDTLNHGMFVGQLSTSSYLALSSNGATPKGGLYATDSVKVTNLNAGGIYGDVGGGSATSASVSISGFGSINYEVAGCTNDAISSNDLSTNNFVNYESNNQLHVSEANIGVVVGHTAYGFTFVGNGNLNSKLQSGTSEYENLKECNSFRVLVGTQANIGSVLGFAETDTVKISSNITSDLQALVVGSGSGSTLNFGGMVGQISADSPNVEIGSQGSTLSYTGGVYSKIQTVNFGGVLGYFEDSNNTSSINDKLELKYASFSGALKIFGNNSTDNSTTGADICAGGIAGNIEKPQNTQINIHDNKVWGDVFVEYKDNVFTKLNTYCFGGIIGNIADYTSLKATNNISAMTSHNARYEDKENTAHALFGSGVEKDNNTTLVDNSNNGGNYYSHSVALLTDDLGIDCGYKTAYTTDNQGYGASCDKTQSIITKLGGTSGNSGHNSGHKLNPQQITNSTLSLQNSFNGITYYYLDSNTTNYTTIKPINLENKNFAIIGDGLEHDYTYSSDSSTGIYAPINALSGYSFVSSVILNVKINVDSTEQDKNFGGLIGTMSDNSILFASQVKGSIEVGLTNSTGSGTTNVAGLVGLLEKGKISNCSTDVDIVYRAEKGGHAYGFAQIGSGDILNRIIENSYSAGSIKTYINANVHAFTGGASNSHVNNSYTITRIFWDDFTVENPAHDDTVITAFGSYDSSNTAISDYTINNCYYDADALGETYAKYTENDQNKDRTLYGTKISIEDTQEITNLSLNTDNQNNPWAVGDLSFNYGYPTLNIGYLKVSSYSTRNNLTEQAEESYDKYVKEYSYTRLPNNTLPDDSSDTAGAYFMLVNKGVVNKIASETKENNGITIYTWADKNLILPYDINTTSMFDSWTFTGNFDGCGHTVSGLTSRFFDTIYNADVRNVRIVDFSTSSAGILADQISDGATISNLVVKGITNLNDNSGPIGAIANTITGSEVNTTTNMVQFKVTASAGVNIGGFAGEADSSTFRYCSNYGNINVVYEGQEPSSSVSYDIVYPANWGANKYYYKDDDDYILSTDHQDWGNRDLYQKKITINNLSECSAGGFVGKAEKNTQIENSYNAASVIVGYTNTQKASYRAGGLVGTTANGLTYDGKTLVVKNSYNAGMIKAGNKSNGSVDDNGVVLGGAYAGGIVAYGEDVTISDCFNEGTIEALGKNPTTQFEVTTGESDGTVPNTTITKYKNSTIALKQTNPRNVWAYGIGYCGDSSSIEKVQSIEGYENIFNNGSYRNSGDIYTINFENKSEFEETETGEFATTQPAYHWWVKNWYTIKSNYTNVVEKIYVKSKDSLGIPNSLSIFTDNVYYWNYYYSWDGVVSTKSDTEDTNVSGYVTNQEYISKNFSDTNEYNNNLDTMEYYLSGEGLTYSTNGSEGGNKKFTDGKTQSSIKSSTRSQYELTGDDVNNSVKTIAGTQYYFVDKNNSSQIFNAGISTAEIKFNLIDNSMPYVADPSYYEVTVNSIGDTISAKITNVTDEELTISLISPNEIIGDVNYTVTCTYAENAELSVEDLKYIYTNDYSYGILVGDKDFTDNIYAGATLTYSEGATDSYSKVIKASTVDYYAQGAPDAPTEGDNSYIYFAYDELNNMLIYIPNAILTRGNGGNITVNKVTIDDDNKDITLKPDDFRSNIENAINWLKSQTLYLRTKTSATESVDLNISQNRSQTFTLQQSTLNPTTPDLTGLTLSYGNTIVVTNTRTATDEVTINHLDLSVTGATGGYAITSGANQIAEYNSNTGWTTHNGSIDGNNFTTTIVDNHPRLIFANSTFDSNTYTALLSSFATSSGELTKNTSIASSTHKIEITLSNPTQDTIALKNNDIIWGYDKDDASWNSNITQLTLGSDTFNVSVVANKIVLDYAGTTVNPIANNNLPVAGSYLTGLIYIVNDDFIGTNEINEPDTTKSGILVSEDEKIKVNYNATNPVFSVDNNNLICTVNNNTITVGFKDSGLTGLTSYTLNDITIYYGAENYNLSHTYDSINLKNISITGYRGSYWTIDDSTAGGFVNSSESGAAGNALDIDKNFSGGSLSVDVDILPTFDPGDIDENEDYDFKMLVKNTSSNDYVAVTGTLAAGALTNIYKYSKLTAETFKEYVNYYVKDGADEYVKATEFNSTTYYIYDFNSEGDDLEYIQVDNPQVSDFSILYWKNNNDEFESVTRFDISKTYYTKNENGQYVELLVPEAVTNETAIATLIKYDKGTTKHLYVSLEGYTSTIGESFGEYTSTFTKNKYAWEEYGLPEYQKQEWQASVITTGFDYSSTGYDANQYKVVPSTEEPTKVIVLLKKLGYESVTISSSKKDGKELEVSANKTVSASSKLSALSIILTNDISFNKHENINKAKGINVVGNGFNLTTIGQVYNYIYVNNTEFIRDINLLCENTTNSIFANRINSGTLSLKNISLYGTLNNHTVNLSLFTTSNSTALVGWSSPNVSINVSSFNLYLNVNNDLGTYSLGVYGTVRKLYDLYIFPTLSQVNDIKNYGVIYAKDGYDGRDYGFVGKDGASVYATSNSDQTINRITNEGVIKVGLGGNGFGGRDYDNNDLKETRYFSYILSGAAGTTGGLYGFGTDIQYINKDKKAMNGANGAFGWWKNKYVTQQNWPEETSSGTHIRNWIVFDFYQREWIWDSDDQIYKLNGAKSGAHDWYDITKDGDGLYYYHCYPSYGNARGGIKDKITTAYTYLWQRQNVGASRPWEYMIQQESDTFDPTSVTITSLTPSYTKPTT